MKALEENIAFKCLETPPTIWPPHSSRHEQLLRKNVASSEEGNSWEIVVPSWGRLSKL